MSNYLNKKIALIDDEIDVLDTIYEVFEDEGFSNLHKFNCPLKFIKNAENEKFDYVVSDLLMPKLSGLNIYKKLHQKNCLPKLFFLISGTELEDIGVSEKPENIHFFSKPFDFNNLFLKIKSNFIT